MCNANVDLPMQHLHADFSMEQSCSYPSASLSYGNQNADIIFHNIQTSNSIIVRVSRHIGQLHKETRYIWFITSLTINSHHPSITTMPPQPSTPSPKKPAKQKGIPLISVTKKKGPQIYVWEESKRKRKTPGKWVKDKSPPRKRVARSSPTKSPSKSTLKHPSAAMHHGGDEVDFDHASGMHPLKLPTSLASSIPLYFLPL